MATNQEILKIRTAVILGAGNVAWHLGHALRSNGINILQIINRTPGTGKLLAHNMGAGFTTSSADINKEADLYVLAVSEDATVSVASSLGFLQSGILVHTSGSLPMDILSEYAAHYGVFYPFQTFTKEKSVDFKRVPMLIEANDDDTYDQLIKLASGLTDQIFRMNSHDRLIMHCAAVMGSNFTNLLLLLSEKLLKAHSLSLHLLKPLMTETISKAFETGPQKAQTGPARRGNREIIQKHLDLLKPWPDIQNIYKSLSESIMQHFPN